jgi:hypothetical protein
VRSAVTVDAIQEQLERILASSTFQQADRLRRFLTCVVEETKAGRGSQLKEYVLGVQVFDKDTSFDPRTDPYGKGRVFYSALGHDAKTWDNPDVYHMYYEALKWALRLNRRGPGNSSG